MVLVARVRLLTRAGCHLCEDAERVVERTCATKSVSYELVDVDSDAVLKERYSDHVPVLIVDGDIKSYWFVEESKLLELL